MQRCTPRADSNSRIMPTMDARRGAWKCGKGTIVIKWQEDEKYRNSQLAPEAPARITLVCNDDDREAGPIRGSRDFEPTTKIPTSLRQQQGRQHYSIPKNERMRQRTFDKEFRPELEWMSQNRKNLLVATFFLFSILTKMVATRTSGLSNGANTKTHNGEITNGKITNGDTTSGGKSEGYRLFANRTLQSLCKILAHS